ncbi:MAG TPA: hypothetical protein PLZ20_18540, partial [Nitrospira sp.]|nr:hypothetical protein [Nitrospira sp.]
DTHPAALVTGVESGAWEGAHMKDGTTPPSTIAQSAGSEGLRLVPRGPQGLAARLFTASAARWRRRAQLYQRHL